MEGHEIYLVRLRLHQPARHEGEGSASQQNGPDLLAV